MNAKKSRNLQAFLYLAILLAIASVIGFFAFFTNGFTEDYKSFYVVIDGERVLSSKSGLYLEKATPMEVEVKYALASVGDPKIGYSVSIVPNAQYEFDFTVDGEPMSFGAIQDCKAGFLLQEEEGIFMIAPKGNLRTILEAIYPDKKVEFTVSTLEKEKDIFTLIITSYNGKDSVKIHFRVMCEDLEVSVEPEVIWF